MSADLVPSENEAEVAFGIETRVKAAILVGRKALWDLAEALYEFDEAKGWYALGHENLSSWLADADVTISRPTYYRYVRTWRKLVVEKQISAQRIKQLDQSKVAIVADLIHENRVVAEDALADVEAMPAQDLRVKYLGKEEPAPKPEESVVPEPEPRDEPPTADTIDVPSEIVDVTDHGEPVGEVVVSDEVQVPEGDFEFPGWVTLGAVTNTLNDLKHALDSGAQFPRIGRRHAQVAQQLAEAWLAKNPS